MKACSHSEDEATCHPVRFGAPAHLRYNPPHDGPRGAEAGGDGAAGGASAGHEAGAY